MKSTIRHTPPGSLRLALPTTVWLNAGDRVMVADEVGDVTPGIVAATPSGALELVLECPLDHRSPTITVVKRQAATSPTAPEAA